MTVRRFGAEVSYLRIRPNQPLSPHTHYELLLNGEPATSFTTGAAEDLTAPLPGEITDVERVSGGWEDVFGSSSCGTRPQLR